MSPVWPADGYTGKDAHLMRERDNRACPCGHKNISHGYGWQLTDHGHSRIGLGACGMESCACVAFAPAPTYEHTGFECGAL